MWNFGNFLRVPPSQARGGGLGGVYKSRWIMGHCNVLIYNDSVSFMTQYSTQLLNALAMQNEGQSCKI